MVQVNIKRLIDDVQCYQEAELIRSLERSVIHVLQ